MTVEYDCWKCGIWHEAQFDSMTEIEAFVKESGASVRNVNTLEIFIRGGNG
jgi:hypothetical protein